MKESGKRRKLTKNNRLHVACLIKKNYFYKCKTNISNGKEKIFAKGV